MSLFAKLKERRQDRFATATSATFATHEPVLDKSELIYTPSTVATVATVAVAKPPKRKEIQPGINDGLQLERQLLEAAMRACDFWGDSQTARAEMVADIKATPSNRRQELLEHFLTEYGKAK